MGQERRRQLVVSWVMGFLVFIVLGAGAVLGLELYVDRFSWLVDPSWYRLEEQGDEVQLGCQRFRPVSLTRQPAPGTTRILMLGGSTTFGFPERPRGDTPIDRPPHGFVGMVQSSLDLRYPGRFELVNLGINGGGSTDTLRVLRAAGDLGASAMVVYDGNNEFLPAPERFSASMWSWALYRQLTVMLPRPSSSPGWVGSPAHQTDGHRAAIVELFRSKLIAIVKEGKDAGMKVLLATQAVNRQGVDPNWSTSGTPDEVAGLRKMRRDELHQLLAGAPDSADLAWELGHRLRRRDDYRGVLLQKAVDNDGLQLRAGSDINRVIKEVARGQGATLVDAAGAMRAAESVSSGPLFYDWVHPRAEGAGIVAAAVLDGLVEAQVVDEAGLGVTYPEVELSDRLDGELRAARSWVQWACVRGHDPAHRLNMASRSIETVLKSRPWDPEAQALRKLVNGWEQGGVVLDPELSKRLGSLHHCISSRLAEPSEDQG